MKLNRRSFFATILGGAAATSDYQRDILGCLKEMSGLHPAVFGTMGDALGINHPDNREFLEQYLRGLKTAESYYVTPWITEPVNLPA